MDNLKPGRPVKKRRWLPARLVRARIALEWSAAHAADQLSTHLHVRVGHSTFEGWERRTTRPPAEVIDALEAIYSSAG